MNSVEPLPYGWIQQVDPKSGHVFFVDTKSNPPRSIWTHPYEDEQFLRENPDIRDRVRGSSSSNGFAPPPQSMPRRHSYHGRPATPVEVQPPPHKKGFFDKMKDKAKKSMEEYNERKRQQLLLQQQMYGQSRYGSSATAIPGYGRSQYAAPQYAYPQYGLGGGMGRRRGMGGGMALPLMGGMAGGLLLGDLLDNDYGGGFDGGGFDGGGGNFF